MCSCGRENFIARAFEIYVIVLGANPEIDVLAPVNP